jgi:dipeptidyl aminopeptidase/acylaminoacyl peptidase
MRSIPRLVAACVCLFAPVHAQNAGQVSTVPPPPTLSVEGAPPLPKTLWDGLAPYVSYKFIVFASWHPSERQMLVTTRFGDTFQAALVTAPLAPLKQVTFQRASVGEWTPGAGNAWLADDGRSIVFRQDQGGNALAQLFRQSLEGGEPTLLTDGQAMNSVPVFSHKGDRIAYTSTRRNAKDRDLWVMNPSDSKSDRMVAGLQGNWTVLSWSPDDTRVLVKETVAVATDTRLWQIDVATGEKKRLTPEGRVAYDNAVYSADGGSLFLTTDSGGEFKKLARLALSSGSIAPLASSVNWDIEEVALSPSGRQLAFVANEAGVATLYLLDTKSGKERRVQGLPPGQVKDIQWRPHADELSFDVNSTKQPWTVYSLDASTGRIVRWTAPETGGVDTSQFVDAEVVRWKSFDGLTISGVMYRPPARFRGRRPVVINIHGGPESQERPRFLGRSNYLLNELGIAIIYPNVRGSAGFGKTFMSLDNGFLRENAVKDLGALLDWIAEQKYLDKSRVSLAGASYGGTLSLAAAAAYPDRIRCAFDGFGMSNIATFLDRLSPAIKPVRRPEYGDESDPAVREYLDRIAPLTHAGRLRMPLYVAHGRNDVSVPVQESEQLIAAVKGNGTPLWVVYATNAGHGFANSKANDDYTQALWVLFLKEYLLSAGAAPGSAASTR